MKIKKSEVFQTIPQVKVGRSIFPLSYEKKFTCDMGQLIPIMCDELVPGDHFKIGCNFLIRFEPLMSPLMHEVYATVHYFFVPYRLLWNEELGDESSWEEFTTGPISGPTVPAVPLWDPGLSGWSLRTAVGTLWDYMGMPVTPPVMPPVFRNALPTDFPRRAYYLVWNEYYRTPLFEEEVDITDQINYEIQNRAWRKDYFTSALPSQQRGTAPAIPTVGGHAEWSADVKAIYIDGGASHILDNQDIYLSDTSPNAPVLSQGPGLNKIRVGLNAGALSNNTINGLGISVAELRSTVQVQKFLERSLRGGNRYCEFLRAMHGVAPRDERLQRPEFLGGSNSRLLFSEVLQTSETATTPQGTMAGHGIGVNSQNICSYYAKEFGLILGLLSVCPTADYMQGINRQWRRLTPTDYFNPLFAHLSEQAIENVEIFASDDVYNVNTQPFGFQGMYSEMRYKQNMICGLMRTGTGDSPAGFNFWHLGRVFESLPYLNDPNFFKCVPDKRIFAVPSAPGLKVQFGNIITAIRPIPIDASPGYVDHF